VGGKLGVVAVLGVGLAWVTEQSRAWQMKAIRLVWIPNRSSRTELWRQRHEASQQERGIHPPNEVKTRC